MKVLVLLMLFLSSCAGLRTEFNPVGKLGNTIKGDNKVKSPENIAVYLKSAPEGFTLKENELEVEEGYGHIILGEVTIFSKPNIFENHLRSKPKSKTINELKFEAYNRGANAIIYCVINISDKPSFDESKKAGSSYYGSGWAVVVEDKYLK